MKFNGFDWDKGNWPKCAKHGLTKKSIEAMFHQTITVFDDPSSTDKDQRYRAIGQDETTRKMFVVFCMREIEGLTLIRPISARYMHEKEIKAYDQDNQ